MLYRRFPFRHLPVLRLTFLAIAATAVFSAVSAAAPPLAQRRQDVQTRLEEARRHAEQARTKEGRIAAAISETSERIDIVEGEASAAAAELRRAEASLARSERELARLAGELERLTRRLKVLRRELAAGQRLLSDRVVAIYTLKEPDLIGVVQRSLAAVTVDRKRFEAEAQALQAESARISQLIATAPPPSSPLSSSVGASSAPAPTSGAGGAFIWPVQGVLTSPFGWRWGRMHEGIDIGAPAGATVVASGSGYVIHAGRMSGYGLLVLLQHPGGVVTAYAHNSSVAVSVGQPVSQGQQIASVGCTGHCFGDHVHFEVRVGGSPTDPMGYL